MFQGRKEELGLGKKDSIIRRQFNEVDFMVATIKIGALKLC